LRTEARKLAMQPPFPAPAKSSTFDQQTNLMMENSLLKIAEEISWLPTFFSGNFC
jgi:hypothetical protein